MSRQNMRTFKRNKKPVYIGKTPKTIELESLFLKMWDYLMFSDENLVVFLF